MTEQYCLTRSEIACRVVNIQAAFAVFPRINNTRMDGCREEFTHLVHNVPLLLTNLVHMSVWCDVITPSTCCYMLIPYIAKHGSFKRCN